MHWAGNLRRSEAFPIGNATAADTVEALGFQFCGFDGKELWQEGVYFGRVCSEHCSDAARKD